MPRPSLSRIIALFALLTMSTVQAQSVLDNWSAKGGFTLSTPTVTINNVVYQVSDATGYQIVLGRLLPIRRGIGVQLSGGLTQMRSTLQDIRDFTFNEELSQTYWLLEAGIRGERPVGKLKPFSILAFRGSRAFEDNLSDILFLTHRASADYGLSVSVGAEYALAQINPFVEIGYYYGLLDIVSTTYTDGSGQLFRSEIANRSWAFLVGVRF